MAEARGTSASWLASRGSRCALWSLLLLVASAIYAPFIANDEPYYWRGVDFRALRSAASTLAPLELEWRERIGDSGYEPGGREAFDALDRRLAAFERHLGAGDELLREVQDARAALQAAHESSQQFSHQVWERVRTTTANLEALAPRLNAALPTANAPVSAPEHLRWRAATRWPLFERVSWFDWWLALLAPVAAAVALGKLVAGRRVVAAVLLASAASVALAAAFDPPHALHTRDLKQALARNELPPGRAVFAPVPYGYAETRLSEALRPPTWLTDREEQLQPSQAKSGVSDATARASLPVEVRPGEPEPDAWNRHLMGTDTLGRDVLTRVLWGGRVSLAVAFCSVALLLALGVAAGLAAGVSRGAFDALFLVVVQTLQSFPSLFLILVAAALLPARGVHPQLATALVIALVGWTSVARLVRGEVRALREREWVLAARASGLSSMRVLWAHIAPNAVAPAIVSGAFALGGAVLAESATSFLGFGVQPPVPSWGAVLRESSAVEHLWILLFPGLAVFATVASANALGDALRRRLDLREEEVVAP